MNHLQMRKGCDKIIAFSCYLLFTEKGKKIVKYARTHEICHKCNIPTKIKVYIPANQQIIKMENTKCYKTENNMITNLMQNTKSTFEKQCIVFNISNF